MSKSRDIIDNFEVRGKHWFTTEQFQSAHGGSAFAARQALWRLTGKKLIASPARGFYVLVPPVYRRFGCTPANEFAPMLMEHWGLPYYVGMLTAARYYGAGHHPPHVFQVAVEKPRPRIQCGDSRVEFLTRKNLAAVETSQRKMKRGSIPVSTPEATAIDLIGYPDQGCGLDNVATVLAELIEEVDSDHLVELIASAPIAWAQRMGYILDYVGAEERIRPLKKYVQANARNVTPLAPWYGSRGVPCDTTWKVAVNHELDPDAWYSGDWPKVGLDTPCDEDGFIFPCR